MKAIIYTRVSTEEQARHGFSLTKQELECKNFATRNGYEILKIFKEEGVSAKDLNRTQLKAMFEYCTQKYKDVDALIFWKWDRLSRGEQSDYLELGKFFDKNNIKPLSVTENNEETAEAELLRWINQGTSRYEWRKIQERTKLGMRGAVEQGRWVNLAPVGYKNDKEKSLIPCPVNAKYIKMAFELFATGLYSQTELIDKLRIAGMEKLDKNKIGRILRNKVYIGMLTYEWLEEPKRGIFEPLIDDETFYKVQAILDGKKPIISGYKRNREDFPLRRYVRCPYCNTPLTASYSKGRKEKYAYYHCHNKDCNIKFRVAKSRIESDFIAHLEQIKPKKELLQLFRAILEDTYENSIKEQKTTLNRLNKELEELIENKKKLTKRYLEDRITENDYKLVNEDYDSSINSKKADIATIELPDVNIEQYLNSCTFVLNNIKDLWLNGSLDFRQRLQKLIYPEGIQYNLSEFRTHKKSVIFDFLDRLTDNKFNMGRKMGFEPTHIGTTIRGLNHLTTSAISYNSILSKTVSKSRGYFIP